MIKLNSCIECCGCNACYNVCPVNAIEMIEDEKGFKYPKVDLEKCIKCGLCEKTCPIKNFKHIEKEPVCYACKNSNSKIVQNSSSGGIFTILAEYVLNQNGVIYGAAFDSNFDVIHKRVDNIHLLDELRRSKYVQSDTNITFKLAKQDLNDGKLVLYTGTPCQIEGLRHYLKKDYDNLITQDIVCHGVPSPKIWKIYKKFILGNEKIKFVNFRDKDTGWKLLNLKIGYGKKIFSQSADKNLYMQSFLKNANMRESCFDCKFKDKCKKSDFTLGDLWGSSEILKDFDDDNGISLVMINTPKAKGIFDSISNKMSFIKEIKFEDAIKYNPNIIYSSKADKKRNQFFENAEKISFDKLMKKFTYSPNIVIRGVKKIIRIVKK